MNELIASGVGVLAAGLSMASFPPQIVKIVRERDAEAVSTRMYLATVSGFAAWTAYALMIGSWPLAGSNLINFILAGTILVLKLRFRDRSSRTLSTAVKKESSP
jgi:MtN3 and saliva related transmembrane protein